VDKIRWGIAATGGIAVKFADGLRLVDDGAIVAVASRSQDAAEVFGDRFGIERRHGSYEALAADPDVDVVYVASPHSAHEANTVLFLEAGKHVLCEKPMALNERQVRRMTAVARAHGLFLMEAVWSRFLPAYRRLGDLLAEERIGTPLLVEADFGFRLEVMPEHRLFDRALGGGAALDLGIYPLQLCSLVLGSPDRVAAVGHVGATDVDEQMAAVLHHAGGALGVVKAATRIGLSCRARISGSQGWIDLPAMMHCPQALTVGGPKGTEKIDLSFTGEGLRFQVHEVHRCLREGLLESPIMPLDESGRLASTLDEIRRQIGVVYDAD
jgi:predicted dehydrogenase